MRWSRFCIMIELWTTRRQTPDALLGEQDTEAFVADVVDHPSAIRKSARAATLFSQAPWHGYSKCCFRASTESGYGDNLARKAGTAALSEDNDPLGTATRRAKVFPGRGPR
jgi:hypothetical protein